jgi:hypothetical protein
MTLSTYKSAGRSLSCASQEDRKECSHIHMSEIPRRALLHNQCTLEEVKNRKLKQILSKGGQQCGGGGDKQRGRRRVNMVNVFCILV